MGYSAIPLPFYRVSCSRAGLNYRPLNVNKNPISSGLLLPSSHPVPAARIRFTISGAIMLTLRTRAYIKIIYFTHRPR